MWGYTPRQAYAYMFLASRRLKLELANHIYASAVAFNGKDVKKELQKIEKEI